MAKFKKAGTTKKTPPPASTRGLIPCGVILLVVLVALFFLMSGALKSGK